MARDRAAAKREAKRRKGVMADGIMVLLPILPTGQTSFPWRGADQLAAAEESSMNPLPDPLQIRERVKNIGYFD